MEKIEKWRKKQKKESEEEEERSTGTRGREGERKRKIGLDKITGFTLILEHAKILKRKRHLAHGKI